MPNKRFNKFTINYYNPELEEDVLQVNQQDWDVLRRLFFEPLNPQQAKKSTIGHENIEDVED
jgi:hypothetical protein